jgi:hypothetical protein
MRACSGLADFLAQELQSICTLPNLGCQNFNRERLAFDFLVARQIDDAHTALTQLALEAVAPPEQLPSGDRLVG